jgi:hypothetical protein
MRKCPHCGKKIQEKTTVCPYCGKVVNQSLLSKIKTNKRYQIGLAIGVLSLVLIIAGGVIIANRAGLFAPRQSCYAQSQDYLTQFAPLFSQWNDAYQKTVGLNKNEIELALFSLEGIRDHISMLTPPNCAKTAHQLFLSYMDETLNGYNAFISQSPGATVQAHIEKASTYYGEYRGLVLQLYPELSSTSTPYP